jgi:proton-dependent oligopeptide transporter, POT family
MGFAFMSLFVSNNMIGWIGSFYGKMPPVEFWAMHAGIATIGGLLVLTFGRRLNRTLRAGSTSQ